MTALPATALTGLPADVARGLTDFVAAAGAAFGDALLSVVLYGSGAEAALRATSDVNVIVVLRTFDRAGADRLREPLRLAHATIRLKAMFLLRDEVGAVTEAFAQKFDDVRRRHRVLWGEDPFAALTVSRRALLGRLEQVLLNVILRGRAAYVERSLREEQIARVVADLAAPLRTTAASVLEIEGRPAASPKAALQQVAAALGEPASDATLARLSQARETGALPAGTAGDTLLALIGLAARIRAHLPSLA